MSRPQRGRPLSFMVAGVLAAISLHGCGGSTTSPGSANTVRMTLDYQNACSGPIDLKFFDRTNAVVWPDASSSYEIASQQRRSFDLNCRNQAQVCYGASERANTSHYWGVGIDNTQSCSDCCVVCGQTPPPVKVLTCS